MAPPITDAVARPLAVRVLWRVYRGLASLGLAVIVIALSAVVLGWATFVEQWYGAKAVHFGVYGTWWFAALVFLLGLNVLCAAIIRFPWKKHQTGFVVTHTGILVLLLGCSLSWIGGIDAQMPIFEGTAAHRAFVDTQHFELTIHRRLATQNASESASQEKQPADPQVIRIPFAPGPFNWDDYNQLPVFPWALGRPGPRTLYERDGIRLEILDYLSDSRSAAVPPLRLQIRSRSGKASPSGDAAPAKSGDGDPDVWQSIELGVQDAAASHAARRRVGLGGRQTLPGGQQIVFWVAGSQAETDAFLNSQPDAVAGSQGQIVLFVDGKRHILPLEKFAAGSRLPLGETGLDVQLLSLDEQVRGVSLRVLAAGERSQPLKLLADYPEFNQHDKEHGVYGTFWQETPSESGGSPSRADASLLRGIGRPRIDILQGVDGQLRYRVWKSPRLEASGLLAVDGGHHASFAGTADEVSWYVDQFIPHDRPGERIEPAPFSVKKESSRKTRRALVRLSVDGVSEQFWLDGTEPSQFTAPPHDDQRRTVCAGPRRVAVTLAYDEVQLGFRVRLRSFNRKLDPGTSMASHYSSLVDLLAWDEKVAKQPPESIEIDSDDGAKVLREKVLITLNEPVNFSDPRTGRSYRLFQESFAGPWKPGEEQFDQWVPSGSKKDQLFISFLTVNYDPGRGLKYAGSLLIVAGVGVMFYMRAYFFRRRRSGGTRARD